MAQRQAKARDAVNWVAAVFAGACAGGVLWAIVARVMFFSATPGESLTSTWVVLAAICVGLVVTGGAVAAWAHGAALRTAGVAAAIAPLTGATVLAIAGALMATSP